MTTEKNPSHGDSSSKKNDFPMKFESADRLGQKLRGTLTCILRGQKRDDMTPIWRVSDMVIEYDRGNGKIEEKPLIKGSATLSEFGTVLGLNVTAPDKGGIHSSTFDAVNDLCDDAAIIVSGYEITRAPKSKGAGQGIGD